MHSRNRKAGEGRIELDGTVLFDSKKGINLPPQKRRVGYMFQNYALFPNMTVRQNILCGMRHIKDKAEKEARLNKYVSMFRLEGLENHRPAQLSGGQAQRTALARIMVSDPKLLLLDEPFSALDAHLRDKLMIEMRDVLAKFGREVIMVTHSRDEAYNMSREIAVRWRKAPCKEQDQSTVCRPRKRSGGHTDRLQEHSFRRKARRARGVHPRMGRDADNCAERGG